MQRKASRAELSPDQATAVDLLATGGSLDDVQKATTVEAATVRAWLRDADFVAALNVRTNEVRDTQVARLRSLVPAALDTLEKLVGDPDPAVRLRAATYVLKATGVEGVQWLRIDATTPSNVRAGWEHKERLDALLAF